MCIPYNEWLLQAQRLSVGQKRRIRHNFERTPAMDVYNNVDSWSCYCHRCHEGGIKYKEHQHVQQEVIEQDRVQPVPTDVKRLSEAYPHEQYRVWGFLTSKGILPEVIPEELLWLSSSLQGRILLLKNNQALGRALSPNLQPKWLMYGNWQNQPRVWCSKYHGNMCSTILTEDALSAHKVGCALSDVPVNVVAILGTRLTTRTINLLLNWETPHVITMLDNDPAGVEGARAIRQRLNVFGIEHSNVVVPYKVDPKMLSIEAIRGMVSDLI